MVQKSTVKVVAMPTEVAERARKTLKDDFGHALIPEIVDGVAPCRHCLRIAPAGTRMILLSYRPFPADNGPYCEVGPVFIHAEPCERYSSENAIPQDFAPRELVVRAYTRNNAIHDSTIAPPGTALDRAASFLENPQVAYVHVRNTTYTCFDFQIERGANELP